MFILIIILHLLIVKQCNITAIKRINIYNNYYKYSNYLI